MNCPARLVYFKNIVRSFSDHNLILVSVRMKGKVEDRHDTIARDRSNWDAAEYNRQVGMIDWSPLLRSEDLDFANNYLEQKLLQILDMMAPTKSYQSRKNPTNWLDKETIELMRLRDVQRQKAKSSDSQDDWTEFKRQRNRYVKEVKNAKTNHFCKLYEKLRNESDVKGIYRLTNELSHKKAGTGPQEFHSNGRIIRKPVDMANHQLDYYIQKVKTIMRKIPQSDRNPHRYLDHALENWSQRYETCL